MGGQSLDLVLGFLIFQFNSINHGTPWNWHLYLLSISGWLKRLRRAINPSAMESVLTMSWTMRPGELGP